MWTCGGPKKDRLLDDLNQSDSWTFTSLQPLGDQIGHGATTTASDASRISKTKSWLTEPTPNTLPEGEDVGINAYFSDDDSLRFGGHSPPEMACSPLVEAMSPGVGDTRLLQNRSLSAIKELDEEALSGVNAIQSGSLSPLEAEMVATMRRLSAARLSQGNANGENALIRTSIPQELPNLERQFSKTSLEGQSSPADLISLEEKSAAAMAVSVNIPFMPPTTTRQESVPASSSIHYPQSVASIAFSTPEHSSSSVFHGVDLLTTTAVELHASPALPNQVQPTPTALTQNHLQILQNTPHMDLHAAGGIAQQGATDTQQNSQPFMVSAQLRSSAAAVFARSTSLPSAAGVEGTSARKELEDAIVRIEAHIRVSIARFLRDLLYAIYCL